MLIQCGNRSHECVEHAAEGPDVAPLVDVHVGRAVKEFRCPVAG